MLFLFLACVCLLVRGLLCENNATIFKDDDSIRLGLLEHLRVSPESFQGMSSLFRITNYDKVSLAFPKSNAQLLQSCYLIQAVRNGNNIEYYFTDGPRLMALYLSHDREGYLSFSMKEILGLGDASHDNFSICTDLAQQSDRVFIFCKEVQKDTSKARLRIVSFLKTDHAKTSEQFTERSDFEFSMDRSKQLGHTYCTYQQGVEVIEYILIYDLPTIDSAGNDILFIFMLKERKIRPHFLNVTAQIMNYSRLLNVGCNWNEKDGQRYLFFTHQLTQATRNTTMIVPISDGLVRLFFATQNYTPPTNVSQYEFMTGVCHMSKELAGQPNRYIIYQQLSDSYRYVRVSLIYIPIDSITFASKFIESESEIIKQVNFAGQFTFVRMKEKIQGIALVCELGTQGSSSNIIDIFLNEKLDGNYVPERRVVGSYSTFFLTVRSVNSTYDVEYLILTEPSTSKQLVKVDPPMIQFYSLTSLFMSLNVKNGEFISLSSCRSPRRDSLESQLAELLQPDQLDDGQPGAARLLAW